MNVLIVNIVVCVFILNLCGLTLEELFTAITDLEPLLETHKSIMEELDEHVNTDERPLRVLKRYLNIYKREHEKAMEDIPNYLGNPINAFTLIKRLTKDLDFIERCIEIRSENIKNGTIIKKHEDLKYPTLEDLTGAAQALTRLQETYHLDIADLAEGKLNGARKIKYFKYLYIRDFHDPGAVWYKLYSSIFQRPNNHLATVPFHIGNVRDVREAATITGSTMSAGDCYELGKALYNEKDYSNGLAWMQVALRKYYEEDTPYPFKESDILDYISYSHYLLGNAKMALKWAERVVALDPSNTRVSNNILLFRSILEEQEGGSRLESKSGDVNDIKLMKESEKTETGELPKDDKNRKIYEALCRGEMELPGEVAKLLTCRYLTKNHPFLRLAPIKMEYMYLGPDIVVFHEVLSDEEIEHIKQMAKPRFRRALVNDAVSGSVPALYRISKSSWLKDEESPVVARVTRRVEDFTGLSMKTAEELQVVNYGIGGHYEPHFDYLAKGNPNGYPDGHGNRIATVLFYMSDVAQGGATVFTELGLSVFPVRGAAVVWLNLHPSGEGDLATRHAACPVLRGSKWVCNKWIHQGGQELLRPCNLEYQSEETMRSFPKPISKILR